MSEKTELLPCPFCGTPMRIESNRDWHRLIGDHSEKCVFLDPETMTVPAKDDQLALIFEDWNTRAAPAEDVRAVVDEPVAWMTECIKGFRNGAFEQTEGPGRTHNNEYWTPDFPVFRHRQRPVVMPFRLKSIIHTDYSSGWNACLDEFQRFNK